MQIKTMGNFIQPEKKEQYHACVCAGLGDSPPHTFQVGVQTEAVGKGPKKSVMLMYAFKLRNMILKLLA